MRSSASTAPAWMPTDSHKLPVSQMVVANITPIRKTEAMPSGFSPGLPRCAGETEKGIAHDGQVLGWAVEHCHRQPERQVADRRGSPVPSEAGNPGEAGNNRSPAREGDFHTRALVRSRDGVLLFVGA